MTPSDWKAKGAYRTIGGRTLFLMDDGDPNHGTILLIHGFPTSSWDWQPIWSHLRKNYRLVAMDMLGFGFSDKPAAHRYSIHEQADLVEGLVQELSLDSFHVLAHDYGDTVAQELLARQNAGEGAGQWLSVCFLNGGLFPETHRALLTQKLLLSPLGWLFNKLSSKQKFDSAFSRVFGPETKPSAQELDDFWSLVTYNDGKHIFHNLITYMNDRKRHRERWVDALRLSRIPIALINGSVDPVSGAHMVVRYKELALPLAWLEELETIGHYPQVEAPKRVSESYLGFLKSVGSPL